MRWINSGWFSAQVGLYPVVSGVQGKDALRSGKAQNPLLPPLVRHE
jgi:hypothetical protein